MCKPAKFQFRVEEDDLTEFKAAAGKRGLSAVMRSLLTDHIRKCRRCSEPFFGDCIDLTRICPRCGAEQS